MLKQITSVFVALLGLLFLIIPVFAQSDQEIAKKYGITFPIAELGNCTSVTSCKTFCDDPKNHQSCTNFAKKHKLSSDSSKTSQKSDDEILKLAKVELGCTSHDACMDFCEREENMEKCIDFAARHNLMEDASQMKQRMTTVKNLLGCGSMKSCMDFCNNPTNMQKCMEVFKQAGFPVEASYSGPGGCNSEESCRLYCEKNPKECGGGNFQAEPPEVWCSKVASDCKWDGTTCTCGQTSTQEGPPPGTDPTEWREGDYSAECAKYGCTFDGKTCQCPSTSSSDKVDFSSQCLSQPGCSWDSTNKTCSCPTQSTSTTPADNPSVTQGGETIYKSECLAAGCRWSDEPKACDCAGVGKDVQGASTNRSLLQQILHFILTL